MKPPALPLPAALAEEDEAALSELFRRGTPDNTLRAWERDLVYIAAWKQAALGGALVWPEDERVALRFVLDHSVDLTETPGRGAGRRANTYRRGAAQGTRLPCPGHA